MSVSIERIRSEPSKSKSKTDDEQVDKESYKGRFGWQEIQKKQIPYIFRGEKKEKYTSVRLVEEKILHSLLTCLPKPLVSFKGIQSYYITAAECRLLNDINTNHCGSYFGKFHFNEKDIVIKIEEAIQFANYVSLCYKRIVKKEVGPTDKCGFVIIGGEGILPFIRLNEKKCIPLFYLEDEDITPEIKAASKKIEGWDMAYIKFCCKIQGIKATLYSTETCKVVPIDKIVPEGTTCEDYWPASHEFNNPGYTRVLFAGGWTYPPLGKPTFVGKQILSPEEYESGIQVTSVLGGSPPQGRPNKPTSSSQQHNQRRVQPQQRTTNYREQTANLIEQSKQLTNSFIQRKNNTININNLRNQVTITAIGGNTPPRKSSANSRSSTTQRR